MVKKRSTTVFVNVCITSLVMALFLFMASTSQAGPENSKKVTKWVGQQTYAYNLAGKCWLEWAKAIETLTNGRLIIKLEAAPAVVPVAESFEAVRTGVLDVVTTHPLAYAGVCPIAYVSMGFARDFDSQYEKFDFFFNRGVYDLLQPIYEQEYNVHWFPQPMGGDRILFNSFTPYRAADMKGKKVRSGPCDLGIVQSLGATPAAIPGPECFTALKLGTVDSIIHGDFNLEAFYGVAKSIVRKPGFGTDTGCMLINYDAWKALPDDVRMIVETATPHLIGGFCLKKSLEATDIFWNKAKKEYGFEVIEWPEEDKAKVRKAAMADWEKAAKMSPINAKIVELYKQQQREIGKLTSD